MCVIYTILSCLSENVSPNSKEIQFACEITYGEPSIVIKSSKFFRCTIKKLHAAKIWILHQRAEKSIWSAERFSASDQAEVKRMPFEFHFFFVCIAIQKRWTRQDSRSRRVKDAVISQVLCAHLLRIPHFSDRGADRPGRSYRCGARYLCFVSVLQGSSQAPPESTVRICERNRCCPRNRSTAPHP